jgi:hypothetical protein
MPGGAAKRHAETYMQGNIEERKRALGGSPAKLSISSGSNGLIIHHMHNVM